MNDPHEQIVQRERELKEAMTPDFIAHLENASKVISTWPKWKQELADKILRPTPQPEQRMEPSYLSPTEREAWIDRRAGRIDGDIVEAIRDLGKRLDAAMKVVEIAKVIRDGESCGWMRGSVSFQGGHSIGKVHHAGPPMQELRAALLPFDPPHRSQP